MRQLKRKSIAALAAVTLGSFAWAQDTASDKQTSDKQTSKHDAAEARTTGEKIEDSVLTARFETILLFNEYLNPFRIDTDTNDGVMTLTGTVDDEIERELAEHIAMSIDGVKKVDNQLTIEPGAEPIDSEEMREKEEALQVSVADANLRATVMNRLAYQLNLDAERIEVAVEEGEVTLDGDVFTEAEREDAAEVAMQTRGVTEVENNLRVTKAEADDEALIEAEDRVKDEVSRVGATLQDEWVEKQVERRIAFNRHLSMQGLDVEVDHGVCTLTGVLIAKEQRALAEHIAQNTKGVESVVNEITVKDWTADTDD